MRIKLVNALVFIFLIFLNGCTAFRSFDYEYEYFNNNIGSLINKNDNGVYILKNIEDINVYKENDLNEKFLQSITRYNEEFFTEKYLIVIILYDKPGNSEFYLSDSNVDDTVLTLEIKQKSKNIMDDSLINKAFIIEVSNEEQYSKITTKIIK